MLSDFSLRLKYLDYLNKVIKKFRRVRRTSVSLSVLYLLKCLWGHLGTILNVYEVDLRITFQITLSKIHLLSIINCSETDPWRIILRNVEAVDLGQSLFRKQLFRNRPLKHFNRCRYRPSSDPRNSVSKFQETGSCHWFLWSFRHLCDMITQNFINCLKIFYSCQQWILLKVAKMFKNMFSKTSAEILNDIVKELHWIGLLPESLQPTSHIPCCFTFLKFKELLKGVKPSNILNM